MKKAMEETQRLIEQNIRSLEGGMLNVAADKLAGLLDEGQRGGDRGSHEAIYASCRAYCEVYERLQREKAAPTSMIWSSTD